MNFWKAATAALAAGVIVLGGKVVFSDADAAPAETKPATVADWRGNQPRMLKAIEALRYARRMLEEASEHHGGWRALSLRHTDEAIHEAERGMDYHRTHPDE